MEVASKNLHHAALSHSAGSVVYCPYAVHTFPAFRPHPKLPHTPSPNMSQQGIFSIAPDSQDVAATPGNSANGSPFAAADSEPDKGSPFTAVRESSPFQQAQRSQPTEQNKGGIPARRPEGQPPALGSGSAEAGPSATPVAEAKQDEEANPFVAVQDDAAVQETEAPGGAFKMNGFAGQSGNQVMEAAPVAPTQETAAFEPAQAARSDYEAAKANLEPQQDFAAVPAQFAPAREQAPVPQAQPVAAPLARQDAMMQAPVRSNAAPAFQQLELRAIFGVNHILDTNEILQRARTLPGIRNVAVVGSEEAAALSNFRQAMQNMGFGDSSEMKLTSGGGSVDFLTDGDSTIAVLLEGSYAPGVQETLIIVAREIGKLA